jgi:hypothetical protein
MVISPQTLVFKRCLSATGYEDGWLHQDVPLGNGCVALVAFSGAPFDARTACITATVGNQNNIDNVAAVRPMAAPVAIVMGVHSHEFWRQQTDGKPKLLDRVATENLDNYFAHHRASLAPEAIYRDKVWGRFERKQRDFVDVGLLPVLEEQMGERITALTVNAVMRARESLGWQKPTPMQGRWLLKSIFRLLAVKILQDKQVGRFIRLDWDDLDSVFARLASHYHSTAKATPVRMGKERRSALLAAATEIKSFAHLGILSTEALAYLYENALVDKVTRQSLGTHSTPSWMVDYVVSKLRPWIIDMPVAERRLFEPACGHGGFLISGLRLLSELRPSNYFEDRRPYLRKRLRGIECDPFAVEIARLSLTLTDVPNPNGWALETNNMFNGDLLAKEAAAATIVLSNPPFERFPVSQRRVGSQLNKATETFRQVIENLPAGGVFGFVLPRSFLDSKQDAELRSKLLSGCELAEVSIFADKVFRCGAHESAVVIGRKSPQTDKAVVYQRVREKHIQRFKTNYQPSSSEQLPQSLFTSKNNGSLFFAELSDVWEALASLPSLGDSAEVGQGLSHKGEDDPSVLKGAVKESSVHVAGLTSGFARWTKALMTHELPPETWLNLNIELIDRPRSGTKCGQAQLVLNYPRVSRGQWCLKALIDQAGRPVTSDFSVIRPKKASLLVFWALLNSPVGNAFAHTHSKKRHVLVGSLKTMPIPDISGRDLSALEQAVSAYLTAATVFSERQGELPASGQTELFQPRSVKSAPKTPPPTVDELKVLHWRVDAEVLRLYALPAELERKLLTFFTGVARRGVPFEQVEYFPERLSYISRLSELIAITADWDIHARRKEQLVEKKVRRDASAMELAQLQELKRLTSARRELLAPLPVQALEDVKTDLIRRGIWHDS